MREYIRLAVNGRLVRAAGGDAFLPLSDFLRRRLGLTDTKVVCAEGDCGACTVLLGRPRDGRLVYAPVDSCILYVFQADGTHVVTPAGLGREETPSPVQHAMIEHFGSQCGFCTPGFVAAMSGIVEQREGRAGGCLTEDELRVGLSGNLCRCTGYVQIIEAGMSIDPDLVPRVRDIYKDEDLYASLHEAASESVMIEGETAPDSFRRVFLPATLDAALEFKANHTTAAIMGGASDLGVQENKGRSNPAAILSLGHLRDLDDVEIAEGVLITGARATWSQVAAVVEKVLPEFHRILLRFGSPQIRNVGTVGGNLANASPIADSLPFYFVTETEVELSSVSGVRRVPIGEFFLGYKKLNMRADELVTRLYTPLPRPDEVLKLYKVSRRKDLDISTFTAAFLARIEDARIVSARIAQGGVGPVVLRLPKTETFLCGKEFSDSVLREAGAIARGEVTPISDVRGSADFRLQLAENIFMKFYHDVTDAPAAQGNDHAKPNGRHGH